MATTSAAAGSEPNVPLVSSYLDYDEILSATFSPYAFANTLITATNNPTDTPLDLDTPLSRVLFDLQEVDTHIDTLTTAHALPLLTHTRDSVTASTRILDDLEAQLATLADGYQRLEREIGQRYACAEEARVAADRLWETVCLGRDLSRGLTIARQLEVQMAELTRESTASSVSKSDDHYRAMVRAARSLLAFTHMLTGRDDLLRIKLVQTVRAELFEPSERAIVARAEQIVTGFSVSSLLSSNGTANGADTGLAHADETRARLTSALFALYLLSPLPATASIPFVPTLLLRVLEGYVQRAITSSLAALTRSLATLPTLDETLRLIAGRCQNIVALETLLDSIKPPPHPTLDSSTKESAAHTKDSAAAGTDTTLLAPLLQALDTPSLPSHFWRSIARNLPPRITDLLKRGGAPARTLRSNREAVREAIRQCVNQGCQLPASAISRGREVRVGTWEREAAVMVGAVGSVLGR